MTEPARRIRILVCDVDGVLTDGGMYYGPRGEALKKFNTRDAQGLALIRSAGIDVAWLTREVSEIVRQRAQKLGFVELHEGAVDKAFVLTSLLERRGLAQADACYIGDDLGDLGAMRLVGLPVAVADAIEEVKSAAHHVTSASGGHGAVREVCELILRSRHTDVSALFEAELTQHVKP